jgi:hypothetical protein
MTKELSPQIDEVDFILHNDAHGWITFDLFVNGRQYNFDPSDVPIEPVQTLARGAIDVLKDESEIIFDWHDEPGTYRWQVTEFSKATPHILCITLNSYHENDDGGFWGHNIRKCTPYQTVEFSITRYMFGVLVYVQLDKMRRLQQEKLYAQEKQRRVFPAQEFSELKTLLDNWERVI